MLTCRPVAAPSRYPERPHPVTSPPPLEPRFTKPGVREPAAQPSTDHAATFALLIVAALAALVAGFLLLLTLAFITDCRPAAGCSFTRSKRSMQAGQTLVFTSLTVGFALCTWRMAQKRTTWRIAVVTLAAVVLSGVMGFIAIAMSAGVV